MCSVIDSRTRDNPERAMLHAKPKRFHVTLGGCLTLVDDDRPEMQPPAWPWPKGDAQCQDKGARFDQAAHEAFMRSLG